MREVTINFLNKQKVQILDAATWLPKNERMEFFGELADWACEQCQEICEKQDDEE